ncbi:hypothetical protein ACFLXA_06365 [Chloroflexota bacterium]
MVARYPTGHSPAVVKALMARYTQATQAQASTTQPTIKERTNGAIIVDDRESG